MERRESESSADGDHPSHHHDLSSTSVTQAQSLLERLSLTSSEAKTLVALMQLGSGTPNQLAPMTGIGRTNVYRVLETLEQKELIHKLPGRNTVWIACDAQEVIWKLRQREQERFQATEALLEDADTVLRAVPAGEEKAVSVFRVIDEVTAGFCYEDAVSAAVDEILVFNRGPYVGEISIDDIVPAALARGVTARALYQSHELTGPEGEPLLHCARAYAQLGVESRVAAHLPLSLAVVDRHLTILALPGDEPHDLAYVASAVVKNRAFARTMAEVFETVWSAASTDLEFIGDTAGGALQRRASRTGSSA